MKFFSRLLPRSRKALTALRHAFRYRPTVFCLITGSPRSGTTAVMRWLEQQRRITAFNESRVLMASHGMMREVHRFRKLDRTASSMIGATRRAVFDYYAERSHYVSSPVIVDKEPLEPIALPEQDYADFMANVRAVIPDSRFLLMVRDPVATVWSMSQRQWGYSLTDAPLRTFTLDEHIANWCACADIVLAWASDPNTYVCQYGRLTMRPEEESARVAAFLGLRDIVPFQPRPSADPQFEPDDYALITSQTAARVGALAAAGLDQL